MNFSIQVHKAKLRRNNHEIPSPPFLCGPVSHLSWFLISDFLLCHFLSLFFSLSLSHIHVLLSFFLSFPSSLLPPFYFLSPLLPSFFLSLPHLPPQGLSIGACHFPQCVTGSRYAWPVVCSFSSTLAVTSQHEERDLERENGLLKKPNKLRKPQEEEEV